MSERDNDAARACAHDLAERETMIADGMCPECLRMQLDAERERAERAEQAVRYYTECAEKAERYCDAAERRERELREQLSVIVGAARLEGRPDLAERIAVLASAKERE